MQTRKKSVHTSLQKIRRSKRTPPVRAAGFAALSLLFGAALGFFSKWLDDLALDSTIRWHRLVERLDLGNFFSDLAVWLLLALVIAVFSRSALQAAVRVFLFFAGMCAAYHLYTVVFSGFNPRQYMMLWYAITLASPLLAAVCWYAKGKRAVSIVLDCAIFAVFVLSCFSVGWFYVSPRGGLYLLVFLGAAAVLYRSPKQTLISLPAGFVLALLLSPVWPFH